LEMKGEPINISNIEKKVKEEFDNLSQKVNNINYKNFEKKVEKGANNLGNFIENFFTTLFKALGKIIGLFIIIGAIGALIFLIILTFTLGSNDLLRSEEHTSELQSRENLVCRLLLEKKKIDIN